MTRARWFVPVVVACATWSAWRWFATRIVDGVDAAPGLVPFAAAFVSLAFAPKRTDRGRPRLVPTTFFLALFAAVSFFTPPSIAAYFAFAAVYWAVAAARGVAPSASAFGLLALALPVLPQLDFFAGYPLRATTAAAASALLQFAGEDFARSGATLVRDGKVFAVDAPCSGVKTLWSALVLAGVLGAFTRATAGRSFLLASVALVGALIGNAFRTAVLCIPDARGVPLSETAHIIVGLVAFGATAAILCRVALRAPRRPRATSTTAPERAPRLSIGAFVVAAASAGVVPMFGGASSSPATIPAPPPPTVFEGRALREVSGAFDEREFSKNFPGRCATLTDGERMIVWRFVREPTRRLHSLAYCYRCGGAEAAALPPLATDAGLDWGRVRITKDGESFVVREAVVDADGRRFGDVSTWWWHAAIGSSRGPWTAWAVVEREDEADAARVPR